MPLPRSKNMSGAPASLLRAAEQYFQEYFDMDDDESEEEDEDWSDDGSDAEFSELAYAADIDRDPRFLDLDQGFYFSGRSQTRALLSSTATATRRKLANIMLNLARPGACSGFLQNPAAVQAIHERMAIMARDVDHLCSECTGKSRSLLELSERVELIVHQVAKLQTWIDYLKKTTPRGIEAMYRGYVPGVGYYAAHSYSRPAPSTERRMHDVQRFQELHDAADRAMEELLAEEEIEAAKKEEAKSKKNKQKKEARKKKKSGTAAHPAAPSVGPKSVPEGNEGTRGEATSNESDSEDEEVAIRGTMLTEAQLAKVQNRIELVGRNVGRTIEKKADIATSSAFDALMNLDDEALLEEAVENGTRRKGGSKSRKGSGKATPPNPPPPAAPPQNHQQPPAVSGCQRASERTGGTAGPPPRVPVPSAATKVLPPAPGSRPVPPAAPPPAVSAVDLVPPEGRARVRQLLALCGQHQIVTNTAFLNAMNPNNKTHVPALRAAYQQMNKTEQKAFWELAPKPLQKEQAKPASHADAQPRAPSTSRAIADHQGAAGSRRSVAAPGSVPPAAGFLAGGPAPPAVASRANTNAPSAAAGSAGPARVQKSTNQRAQQGPRDGPKPWGLTMPGSAPARPQQNPKAQQPRPPVEQAAAANARAPPVMDRQFAEQIACRTGPVLPDIGNATVANVLADLPLECDEDTCVVCMERPRNALVMPCRHTVSCLDCALQIQDRLGMCPYCRTEVDDVYELK